MKKYQLWLQSKKYSQHLNNLLRIKLASSVEKLKGKTTMHSTSPRSNIHQKGLIKDKSSFCLTSKDISYVLTSREMQGHKMRLVRSNQIVRENQWMVKRLNNIKSFVINTKPSINNGLKLKRGMERANQIKDKLKKQQNYKQFLRIKSQNVETIHKYKLIVIVQDNQLLFSKNKCTELFLEIESDQLTQKSQKISPQELNNHLFRFPFTQKLPETFTLSVHQYKNLDHSVLASYRIKRPEEGIAQSFQLVNNMGYNKMKVRILYNQVKHKFHPINHFRM